VISERVTRAWQRGVGPAGAGKTETLTTAGKGWRIDHGLLTPYRTTLPSPVMKNKYKRASVRLIQTREAASRSPRQHVPTMRNARVLKDGIHWVGLEVSKNGTTRQFQ